jgi:glycosyltransferase involved in cell wall biosynthesis
MRIAVWHNLPSGGGLRALDDQLRGLASRGHELHIWTPPSAAPCASIRVAASTHEVPLTVPQRDSALGRLSSVWRGRRADLDAFADHSSRCAQQISDLAPDLVFAHSCQFFRVPAIAEYLEIPSVAYLHEPNRRLYEAPFGAPWAASGDLRTFRPSSMRRFISELVGVELSRIQVRAETDWIHAFDEVLVNSSYSRESTLRAYSRLSRVCRLGIDTDRFRLVNRPAQPRGNVLTVGALVAEKNPEFLVCAVAAAGSIVRRFTWVANYVDRPTWKAVQRIAADTGIVVDLRQALSEAELLQCYAEADVFVYAPRLEPFGLAPLEANATGLPVVGVAEAGVRETLVDGVNGIVVEPEVAPFGLAIATLLGDQGRARSLGDSAHNDVLRRWPLAASIDRLEADFASVLSKRQAKPVAAERTDIPTGAGDA